MKKHIKAEVQGEELIIDIEGGEISVLTIFSSIIYSLLDDGFRLEDINRAFELASTKFFSDKSDKKDNFKLIKGGFNDEG